MTNHLHGVNCASISFDQQGGKLWWHNMDSSMVMELHFRKKSTAILHAVYPLLPDKNLKNFKLPSSENIQDQKCLGNYV